MSAIDATGLDDDAEGEAPKRGSRAPLLIGILLALLLGGGGFYAVFSGRVALPVFLVGVGGESHAPGAAIPAGGAPAFVPIGEMVIPLGPDATAKFLVIETSVETRPEDAAALAALRPRILDVFNTFLRAVEEADIEAPSASIRLRAQLLRRVRAVAAPIEARDLLITSFVLK
ncbi:flagellar basal body-associated FliL family protein [Pikeienuella piscinae]|uniref:Flagellar protein FliL n=2 Tax=Pikeienuella piscinae TaxID=2748098 RepID=A0A7M3T7G2_9RHOB|nr:flagellar basal body-associated FliL family protein [Pikeienuella piscinae]